MRSEIKDWIVKEFAQMYGQDFYNLINLNLSPKKPQIKNGKIPRPSNSFIQFRTIVLKYALENNLSIKDDDTLVILSSDQGYLAKVASILWKRLPKEQKFIFKRLYQLSKEYVERTYPDYKYRP